MTTFADDGARRLIPRWRYSFSTALTAEHMGLARAGNILSPGRDLEDARVRFEDAPALITASELVSSAIVHLEPSRGLDAAQFLLARRSELMPEVIRQAEWITNDPLTIRGPPPISSDANLSSGLDVARRVIATRRIQLRLWPRDPISWRDLARAYAVTGHTKKASRAMDVALQLSPNHRVVLRLAARLAFHLGRADEAYTHIARHPRTKTDPWLMATELAFAQIVDRSPRFARDGYRFVDEARYSPGHLSELAGALATLDLAAGKHRRARGLFRRSLEDPTENAVAQVEWAKRTEPSLVVPQMARQVPNSFEAHYWRARRAGNWAVAVACAKDWLLDEPFSSRPATYGSSIAAMALDDYSAAESFARMGLVADQKDNSLWNNLAVALARRDKPYDAAYAFSRITASPRDSLPRFVANATRGLIAFRMGQVELGRRWYSEADLGASDGDMRKLVLLHWATEELRVDRTRAEVLLQRAGYDEGVVQDPLVAHMRADLERRVGGAGPERKGGIVTDNVKR